MCGVIGYFSTSPNQNDLDSVKALFRESRVRGLHAFGAAWHDGEQIRSEKTWELEPLLERLTPAPIIIGHTRYSTSGDWENFHNNQPIVLPGFAMVFNGVISMKTKPEYEAEHGQRYTSENDGEIFARKVLAGEDWAGWVRNGTFSFAGLHILGRDLYAIRNANRPLRVYQTETAVFFASTQDIFRRAMGVSSDPVPVGDVLVLRL